MPLIAYLIGSIPFGLVLSFLFGKGDIRKIGSGNIGATNVLRTGDKKLALATLILDGLKGVVAVWIAPKLGIPAHLAGMLAILGHIFPVWLKFKGGKGVATYLAVMLAINYKIALIGMAVWLIIFKISKISSLSSIISMISLPIAAYFLVDGRDVHFMILLMSGLVIIKHKENIRRLIKGEESKFKK